MMTQAQRYRYAHLAWVRSGRRQIRCCLCVCSCLLALCVCSFVPQIEVGPLPKPKYWRELVFPKQTPDIHIHSRPISDPEYNGWVPCGCVCIEECVLRCGRCTGG